MNYIGDFAEDETVYLSFNTFTSDDPSASCTITNFVNTDIHVHRDSGVAQRNNAAGVVVSVDFDGITGNHIVAIDTSDNTVADFWITGHDYFVRAEGTTIDGATVNAFIAHFSIENRYTRGTDSAALAATWTDAKAVHLDANISSRNATTPPTAAAIVNEWESQSQADPTGFHVNVKEVNGTNQTANDNSAYIVAIVDDTNELQTDWANAGRLDAILDACNTVTPDAAGVAPTAVEIRQEMDANSTKMAPSQVLADYKATGFSTHDAAAVKTAVEAGGSSIATILADTNELQTDWANGGRLDLLIDAILADTGTTLDAKLDTLLGLGQENFFIDTTTYSGGNMTGARIRIYSVAGSVGTINDVIATYTVTATYSGSEMTDYKVVKS